MLNLRFNPKVKVITVMEAGEIDFGSIYGQIREWEASEQGIVYEVILEGSGNVELPDGSRTPRCMTLLNGWQLSSENEIAIVGGYVTGRLGSDYHSPITDDSLNKIHLLSSGEDELDFVPTEAQKKFAQDQADLFSEDWEIVIDDRPEVRRKQASSDRVHTVFALYWFSKKKYLENHELRKFTFPIQGDNKPPTPGHIRTWQWDKIWSIRDSDLKFLVGGPLYSDGELIVHATKDTAATDQDAPTRRRTEPPESKWTLFRFRRVGGTFRNLADWLAAGEKRGPNKKTIKAAVTVGVITALPKEFAAVCCQLDDVRDYVGESGRKSLQYKVGEVPAFGSGSHTIAATMCEMGNNNAAIRATQLINEFPNLQEIIMVGIAGAVPNPTDLETHARLGDIVVSGEHGVIQYDFVKDNGEAEEVDHRHKPRPPSAQILRAIRFLESEALQGNWPWMQELSRASNLQNSARPAETEDKLADTDDVDVIIAHPDDPSRHPNEPKVFVGTVGAANKLLKCAKQRDELRDKFKIRAIEMESSGISDAAWNFDVSFFVIRGTCDYCDSNKNDFWQGYAATIAGAYFRSLLKATPEYNLLIN